MVFDGLNDPGTLESHACREALSLAVDLNIRHLQVISDCKEVIEDIRCRTLGTYAPVVKEIIVRAASFDECSFSHEFRNSNFEAHKLAKFATLLDLGHHLWLATPHDLVNVPSNILHE